MTERMTQDEFGKLVGISQPAVSGLVSSGVLRDGDPWRAWLLAYCARLREQAAGRTSGDGGADAVYESAMLKRSQRIGQDIKNAVALGQFAPIEVLGDALAKAIDVMRTELDQVDALIAQTAPDLPDATRKAVLSAVAAARNKISARGTQLVMAEIDPADDIDADLEDDY